jgi:hypothetical protein
MVGEVELSAWDSVESAAAISTFASVLEAQLLATGGYLVRMDGLVDGSTSSAPDKWKHWRTDMLSRS